MKLAALGSDDLDAMLALSTAEGWNQTAADWGRMVGLEPAGCFGARAGDRLVATVTTTTYGRDLAWIGMMIVHPDFRRQGIGAALMRLAMDHLQALGIPCIKLDATPAGRPLYEALGFTAETDMERWTGVATAVAPSAPSPPAAAAWDTLVALDREAYRLDRARLLGRLVEVCPGGPLVAAAEDGAPAGYALARRGRAASYVGPIVATTKAAALSLLDRMLERFPGEEVGLDLHRGGWLTPEALAERGLARRRILTRMSHGAPTGAATGPTICASTGPEFG